MAWTISNDERDTMHSEETVAAALPEPEDGARLIVDSGDNEYRVIWRDDAGAQRWGAHELDRWFHDDNNDPMGLYQHLKYARAVYVFGEPVAAFEESF